MNRPFALLAALALVVGCNTVPAPTSTAGPSLAPTASPSAGATPAPTATSASTPHDGPPTPPPTGSPSTGLVVDKTLIEQHLNAFQGIADANSGNRAAGTPGYEASADYVAQVMTDLGYDVERHPFDFQFFNESEPVSVGFGDIGWTSPEWLHAALYSASGDVEAVSEYVFGGCEPTDWRDFTRRRVALVDGGGCFLRQKVENAQAAGAAALISFYPWPANEIRRPTLLDPVGITIPVVVAGSEPSTALRNQEGQIVNVFVHGDTHLATVDNIIATLPGATEEMVMLGGHLDSVLDGPGINDNGSGVATLLVLAKSVAVQPEPEKTIRFGFWAAEEFGDLGSFAYVSELSPAEIGQISAYFNLDMVASPNPGRYVYDEPGAPLGSAALMERLLAAFEALDMPASTTDTGGASDHAAFAAAGVPVAGVFSGISPMTPFDADLFGGVANAPEDPCYHLACDTMANLNLDNAALLGQVIANVLSDLAY
jgi:aminopeptidase Y